MNKTEKKQIISNDINLANGRFKDSELDLLHDIVSNKEKYNGMSRSFSETYDGWSSDGKYTRNENTTYTVCANDGDVHISEKYSYLDDDGQSGSYETVHDTARDFLRLFNSMF